MGNKKNKQEEYIFLYSKKVKIPKLVESFIVIPSHEIVKYLKNKAMLNTSKTILIKHQDIAEDLHTSRVVISRILKQLENENKIKLGRNKIELLSL